MTKKVMITGCSGFLGNYFITAFHQAGYEVIGVDKRPIPLFQADPDHFIQANVSDLGFRDLLGIDFVVHLACITNIPNSVRHPVETTKENLVNTVHLLEVCRETGIKKFFFPSTAALYGSNPTPWTEDMIGAPLEPYGWQKLSIEFLLKMYAEVFGVPTVIGRFFQIFGEFQRKDTAIAKFLELKKEGKPVTLTKTHTHSFFKSGQRDFIYAEDVAQAVVKIMEADTGKGEIFNVATGKVTTMEEIANAMSCKIEWIEKRSFEVERHEADISKLKALGWSSKVDIIDWLKKQ